MNKYLSEEILIIIIKKFEDEILNENYSPIIRLHSNLILKNLYKSNKKYSFLFKNIKKILLLSGYMLDNIELINQDLRKIQFSHSSLEGAILFNCNLKNVNLKYCNLSNANLSNTNLSYTNLSYTNLNGTNLDNSNLKGTNLEGANLKGANLEGTNLEGANLDGAKFR